MALIEFKNVNKYYGDYHALRDINLEMPPTWPLAASTSMM